MGQSGKSELIKKFWEGKTTLSEELSLKGTVDFSDDERAEKAYFSFIQHQTSIPKNMEVEIWSALSTKMHSLYRSMLKWGIAATIAILIGVSGFFGYQLRQEKLAMQFDIIEQTLHHISTELTTTHSSEIIYEDNYIVIVAEN